MLPCRGSKENIIRLFKPLGYDVKIESYCLDDQFSEWQMSRYYTVTLQGEVKLKDLLNHLYLLVPVLDLDKHYWIGEEEIEKLLNHGEGWLSSHPEKEFITSRYLNKRKSYINKALEKLNEDETEEIRYRDDNQTLEEVIEKKYFLNDQRLDSVVTELKKLEVKKVIDIGCGEGKLLSRLLKEHHFTQITGVDVSYKVLEKARSRLNYDRLPDKLKDKLNLFQGSLTYRDDRFNGYDAITIIEVIEHLDLSRLESFEKVIFKYARPKNVIITTPNKDYNNCYENLDDSKLRHKDHRFEWTKDEFISWCKKIETDYGYSFRYNEIGSIDPKYGSPTQMGVFTI